MRMGFMRNMFTGEMECIVKGKEYENNTMGHGFIVISNDAINKALDLKIINKASDINKNVKKGRGAYNDYYVLNPSGYNSYYPTKLNPSAITLVCCDHLVRGYKAFSLMDTSWKQMDMLSKASLYQLNTEGKKLEPGRHMCMSGFRKEDKLPTGVTKRRLQAPLLAALSKGIISSMHNLEPHHKYAQWDMRMSSIECISKANHKLVHKNETYDHRLDVIINNWEELVAFINLVNSPRYYQLFV